MKSRPAHERADPEHAAAGEDGQEEPGAQELEQAREEARRAAVRDAVGSALIFRAKNTGRLMVQSEKVDHATAIPEGFEFMERVFLPGEQDRIREKMHSAGWSKRVIDKHLEGKRL